MTSAAGPTVAPDRTILDGAAVVTMDGARTEHAPGYVVIEHGRIRDEVDALAELGGTDFALGAASWGARAWLGADALSLGASADLIVLDADPREDLSALRRPLAMILRGRVVG